MKDKLGDKYPVVREKFDEAKARLDSMIKKMDEITLRDIFLQVKKFFLGHTEGLDKEEIKQRMNHARDTVFNFFNQLQNYGN